VNQVRQGILAEKLGFQSFWLTEHHFQPEGAEMSPNPLMVQMSVAAHTKRIRLGQAANIIVWHHPVRLAEQIALLDVISGGRVECGIGRGYQPRENETLGRPYGSTMMGLGATQELFDFGKIAAQRAIADASVRGAVQDERAVTSMAAGSRGKVTPDLGRRAADAALATDAAATTGVRMDGTNEIGAVTGTGSTMGAAQQLKLTLFSATAVLQPGQTVVTFGSVGGRPYVPGVPVGLVTQVTSQPGALTQTALVQPFADFTGLGVVGVVVSK